MNMTPKQKAAYLIVKYMSKVVNMKTAKECALVAVDEIKTLLYNADRMYQYDYWYEVKQEIEKV